MTSSSPPPETPDTSSLDLDHIYPHNSHDLRTPSTRLSRNRAHLAKYTFHPSNHRATPIPYALALLTPTPALLPALTDWHLPRFESLLHTHNPPTGTGGLTPAGHRQRVYAAAKVAGFLGLRSRCACSCCSGVRARSAGSKPGAAGGGKWRGVIEEGVRGAEDDWRDELYEKRGGVAWWAEGRHGWEGKDEGEEEREDEAEAEIEAEGGGVDNPWAKLVDDALAEYHVERKRAVEKLGWDWIDTMQRGWRGGCQDDDGDSDSDRSELFSLVDHDEGCGEDEDELGAEEEEEVGEDEDGMWGWEILPDGGGGSPA